MAAKRKTWPGRVYLGKDLQAVHGKKWLWVGRLATKKERDQAAMRRRIELEDEQTQAELPAGARISCGEYADAYLARMEDGRLLQKNGRRYKDSSIDTARAQLKRFKDEFGERPLASVERVWYMKTQLGLTNADIAAEAGRSESSIEKMVATYGHTRVGALDRIKASFSDAIETQQGADSLV